MSADITDGRPVRAADWIIDTLHRSGIRQAFVVTGGGAMHLNDAVGVHDGIAVVHPLHEQAAAIASEAYAKQSGVPALCLVTSGPGGTNAITGVTAAWLDSVPMVVISGQAKRADLVGDTGVRQRGVQEVDIVSMVEPITKMAVTVMDPHEVPYHLEKALHLTSTGRPGPVWLDIPLDVQASLIQPGPGPAFVPDDSGRDHDGDPAAAALSALDLLSEARRPLLLVGAGVRTAGAAQEMLELAERAGVPVLSTWPAHGVLGDDHPLFVGRPGSLAPRGANFALQSADALLCLGARLDLVTTGYDPKDFGRLAKKMVVDIDPNELVKLEGTYESAYCGDVGEVIREMNRLAGSRSSIWIDREGWVERCRAWRTRYPVVTDEHRQLSREISTYRFADALSDVISADDVIALGCSGSAIEVFLLAMRLHTGQRSILNYALGAMGYGPPTALGACVASGGRRTVCVDGDGGLQLNIQELETIRRLGLPVKLFVLNNDAYASIRASQTRWFGRVMGADPATGVTLPPLSGVADAYGWSYTRLDGTRDLGTQLLQFLDEPGPGICDVPTPRDEPRAPAQTSEALPDGGMRSLPLEDMAPRLDREELASNLLGPDGTFPS